MGSKLVAPENDLRRQLFQLVTDDNFELVITILIGLNIIVMSLSWYGAPLLYEEMLYQLNKVFTFIFIAEMALKWLALGITQYFKDKWNRFDALIVFASIVVLILEAASGDSGSGSSEDSSMTF